ncbi:hypothetical protein [Fulvivirga sediminis]|uniref:Uncharacterized protein n=1 Tax=Fulvivirga sediminis TaxID=2803949 RepID=A0A937FAP9_9BACT|nr:hypothetical protein [Fulvivirga sediminis]MBL3658775.1 hypothetical protein [Fulvivirga sediminis]
MKEYDIQKHLWENKETWRDFIEDIKFPDKYDFLKTEGSIYERTPDKVFFNEVIDRYIQIYEGVKDLQLVGCEVPLKKSGDSTIRADLLGTADSCIAIIEIKKSAQTERQAYTELFAYASHLQAIFPTMSTEDIHYVLISPMEERIVREASIYSFLFDEKPVFAFIPIYENNDAKTLKLKPWIPKIEDIIKVTEAAFSLKNFDVFKVAWEEIEGWNAIKRENNPSEKVVARMNRISTYAAQLMETKRVHGFVYTCQGYPEAPLLNNAIVVAGLNPYKIAKDYYLIQELQLKPQKLDSVSDESINLLQIIPELKNKAEEIIEENEHFYNLIVEWSNTIAGIAFDTVRLMTTNDKELNVERGWGGMSWKQYQANILEDVNVFNYDIKATGLLRRLWAIYSQQDYEYVTKHGSDMHPYLHHGDFPNFLVDSFNEQRYFREFLYSIFESYKDVLDEFDDSKERPL